jgi:hypothetical protein
METIINMTNRRYAKEGSAQQGAFRWRTLDSNATTYRNIGSDAVIIEKEQEKET